MTLPSILSGKDLFDILNSSGYCINISNPEQKIGSRYFSIGKEDILFLKDVLLSTNYMIVAVVFTNKTYRLRYTESIFLWKKGTVLE